jgi:hypothetical protein
LKTGDRFQKITADGFEVVRMDKKREPQRTHRSHRNQERENRHSDFVYAFLAFYAAILIPKIEPSMVKGARCEEVLTLKRLRTGLVLLSVFLVFSWPVVGQSHPTPPPKPIPFVEGQPPAGKALIYFFSNVPEGASSGYAVFSQTGPITVLPIHSYHGYVSDPGSLKFFAIAGAGLAFVSRLEAKADTVYYIKFSMGFVLPTLISVPRDEALKELQTGYTSVD